jgi:ring-1,2-phenylacetyl-CoA epoxidase subunit PaaD
MDALARARRIASSVLDPELPQLTVEELGILRDVTLRDGQVSVTITPTYLGCPALHAITADIRQRLAAAGFAQVDVRLALAPPWSSDAITAEGRRKLAEAGIAPPRPAPSGPVPLTLGHHATVDCPRCGSTETTQVAAFGATACKALHRCRACDEPFEYVKAI